MNVDLRLLIKAKAGPIIVGCLLILFPFVIAATNFNAQFYAPTSPVLITPKLVTLPSFSPSVPSLNLMGSLVARSDGNAINEVIFTLNNPPNAEPILLTNNAFHIRYHGSTQQIVDLHWSKRFQGDHNQDDVLDPSEAIQLTASFMDLLGPKLGANTSFVLEVVPAQHAPVKISRTTPAELELFMDLN